MIVKITQHRMQAVRRIHRFKHKPDIFLGFTAEISYCCLKFNQKDCFGCCYLLYYSQGFDNLTHVIFYAAQAESRLWMTEIAVSRITARERASKRGHSVPVRLGRQPRRTWGRSSDLTMGGRGARGGGGVSAVLAEPPFLQREKRLVWGDTISKSRRSLYLRCNGFRIILSLIRVTTDSVRLWISPWKSLFSGHIWIQTF